MLYYLYEEREAKTSLIYLIGVDEMDLNKVSELLKPYLEHEGLEYYDAELVKEDGFLILRVLIDKEGGIDIDSLARCNEFLSEKLDAIDSDMPEYMLEVSSPGAEKELRNLDEIKKNIGKYIHLELPNMVYEGNLLDVKEDTLSVRFNAKGRFRTIEIPYSEIKYIRLAVKI
jgi:Uncharacterized protein conserved in bacteria